MTPTEAVPGHIIDIVDAIIEALHVTTTVLIAFAVTPTPNIILIQKFLNSFQRLQQIQTMYCI